MMAEGTFELHPGDALYPETVLELSDVPQTLYVRGNPEVLSTPALSIIGAVYAKGYVKNKVMEFVGPGVANLPIEYRNGIDVMTTETTCWSSIWETDQNTKDYLTIHGRPEAFRELKPADVAYYDGCVYVDLSTVECTIALPMHPSSPTPSPS